MNGDREPGGRVSARRVPVSAAAGDEMIPLAPYEMCPGVWPGVKTAEHPDALDFVDPITNDAYEDVITRVTATQIRPLLLALPEREREILDRRANDETLRDVARSLGLSHQRVAALEERALSRVRIAADTTRTLGRK